MRRNILDGFETLLAKAPDIAQTEEHCARLWFLAGFTMAFHSMRGAMALGSRGAEVVDQLAIDLNQAQATARVRAREHQLAILEEELRLRTDQPTEDEK